MGHVVDFISLPNFAIFNVADSCVVCGVVLVSLLTLRGVSPDGIPAKEPSPTDGTADGAPGGDGRG